VRARAAPRPRRRLIAVAVVVALAAGISYGAWQRFASRGSDAPASPTYVSFTPSTYRVTISAPGTLRPVERAEVRTATAGTLAWVAPVGSRVAAGSVVARLDPTTLERAERDAALALDRARRSLDATRSDQIDSERTLTRAIDTAQRRLADALAQHAAALRHLEVSERLAVLGAESPKAVEAARDALAGAEVAVADAERDLATSRDALLAWRQRAANDLANALEAVESAELALERAGDDLAAADIRARIDGVVERVDASVGATLTGNALVASVADDHRLHLVAQVDETEIGRVLVGQRADLTTVAVPALLVSGEVVAVAPTAQTAQNIPVFEVTIALDNPDLVLRPGMTAEADIVLREVEGTVTVPSRAVVRGNDVAEALSAGRIGFGAGAQGMPTEFNGRPAQARSAGSAGAQGDGAAARSAFQQRQGGSGQGGVGFGDFAGGGAGDRAAAATRFAVGAGGTSSFAAVRARSPTGEVALHLGEVIATVGANTVLRIELPIGAEIEVPAVATAATTPSTGTSTLFGIPGLGGGGAARFGVPGGRP
jgi:HlyD family secretion protein